MTFAETASGRRRAQAVSSAPADGVVLLENLRFHAEEEKNDERSPSSSRRCADVYVNDAFGTAHRAHARLRQSSGSCEAGAGLLMEKELSLSRRGARRPREAVRRGAGRRQGLGQDRGHREPDSARRSPADRRRHGLHVLQGAGKAGWQIAGRGRQASMPRATSSNARRQRGLTFCCQPIMWSRRQVEAGVADGNDGRGRSGDWRPHGTRHRTATVQAYAAALRDAQDGRVERADGRVRDRRVRAGTIAVARAVADVQGTTIVGGGDSIAAVKKAGVAERITHISTGGGASLEFLGGQTLPGVAALAGEVERRR